MIIVFVIKIGDLKTMTRIDDMFRIGLFFAAALGVAACDPISFLERAEDVDAPEISCATRPAPGCSYDRSPLRVLPEPVVIPKRAYKFFPTAEPLTFVDSRNRTWVAPRRTLTDGASIPPIFVSIVGDPTSPEFVNAAAVHDAYCGIGNETGANFHNGRWEDVHIMFYDALVAGGTDKTRAQIMFAAVWLGGPRWRTSRDLSHVPVPRKQQAMRSAMSFIQSENPAFPALLKYLERQEQHILTEYPRDSLRDDPQQDEAPQEETPDFTTPETGFDLDITTGGTTATGGF